MLILEQKILEDVLVSVWRICIWMLLVTYCTAKKNNIIENSFFIRDSAYLYKTGANLSPIRFAPVLYRCKRQIARSPINLSAA